MPTTAYHCVFQSFRKTLVTMFEKQDEDVVFMETSMHLKKHPHMTVECVPMEREIGDLAPIYFKVGREGGMEREKEIMKDC